MASIIQSLSDISVCLDIVKNDIPYLFTEKDWLVSRYLNPPDVQSDKRQRTKTSLTALRETEYVLTLMCVGAKCWSSWVKAMKEMDSQLREKCIHLLAFISRGSQRFGESLSKAPLLCCPPSSREEVESFKKPSIFNSQRGWFSLSPLGYTSSSKSSTTSSALIVKDQISTTDFSDTVALQIYKIAFLLLKFLCLQAEGAAKRAEEVRFIDLAHFPELPMPEILLHGLQDQAISILTEVSDANKQMDPENQSLCRLLVQIMDMALYLELCVLHICGIRPVSGRLEDSNPS